MEKLVEAVMVKSILQLVTYLNVKIQGHSESISKLNAKWTPHNPKTIEFAKNQTLIGNLVWACGGGMKGRKVVRT